MFGIILKKYFSVYPAAYLNIYYLYSYWMQIINSLYHGETKAEHYEKSDFLEN